MKIGYLGPKGTFSYEACNQYSKEDYEKIEYRTISETIMALSRNEIEECVVPIENSLQGCVTDSIDTLIQCENIYVKNEILISVNQNLMANKKCELSDIQIIYSHPQAIAQCRNFLEKYVPQAELVSVDSTAYSAKKVSEEKEKIVASIANIFCAKEYGLEIIEEKIQDNKENKTKFWVLSKDISNAQKEEKMSMIFSVKDRPGALFDVLKIFNEYKLNLTKIESRPAKTIMGEYYFLIDVCLNNDRNEDLAISEIRNNGIFVRVLGKF